MAFWAYMLRCADSRYYVGHTDDLDRRISQHLHGGFCDFTARRQPVTLIWSEVFQTRLEALETERRIKGWTRAKKEALVAGDWARLKELAASREARPSTSLRTNGEGGVGGFASGNIVHVTTPSVRPEPVEGRAPPTAPIGEAP